LSAAEGLASLNRAFTNIGKFTRHVNPFLKRILKIWSLFAPKLSLSIPLEKQKNLQIVTAEHS
ncbi:MAG: hypothetical protein AAFO76_09040, partial [Cyanobacteria bacterium J06607_15]